MANDTNELIGKLIDEGQERDAIHIAVAPVVAGERLSPGERIAFAEDDAEKVIACQAAIGIVDPFLSRPVKRGDRFWMFLLPNTITSLKHNWTHPAFENVTPKSSTNKDASEAWLRNFCDGADCPEYEEVIAAAIRNDDREYLHFSGRDAHGDIPAEFWVHVENVTGRKIEKRATYFSCSC